MSELGLGYIDILKGVCELIIDEGKAAVKGLFRGPRQLASHGDHMPTDEFDQSSWTPVQQDAAEWMEKVDIPDPTCPDIAGLDLGRWE